MNVKPKKFNRALQVSGSLIILGLLIELVTLRWSHPTSFLVFIAVGGSMMGLGMVLYLLALVVYFERKPSDGD